MLWYGSSGLRCLSLARRVAVWGFAFGIVSGAKCALVWFFLFKLGPSSGSVGVCLGSLEASHSIPMEPKKQTEHCHSLETVCSRNITIIVLILLMVFLDI